MAAVFGVDEVIGTLHDGNGSDENEDFEPGKAEKKLKSRRNVIESKVLEITESVRSLEPKIYS